MHNTSLLRVRTPLGEWCNGIDLYSEGRLSLVTAFVLSSVFLEHEKTLGQMNTELPKLRNGYVLLTISVDFGRRVLGSIRAKVFKHSINRLSIQFLGERLVGIFLTVNCKGHLTARGSNGIR